MMKPYINTVGEPSLVTPLVLDSLYWIGVAIVLVLVLPKSLYRGAGKMLSFFEHPVMRDKSDLHRLLTVVRRRRGIQSRKPLSSSKKVFPITTRHRQGINPN